jgi:hypothetical protein
MVRDIRQVNGNIEEALRQGLSMDRKGREEKSEPSLEKGKG